MIKGPQRTKTPATASSIGAAVEHKASQWLQQQGLKKLEKNYHCRQGEIDIIMRDGQQLVFVEVRYRKNNHYGDGLDSVDWRKQQKLQKAAAHYLLKRPQYQHLVCRFDVLAAQLGDNATLDWSWVKNAFTG
jgi:putative endonuclease